MARLFQVDLSYPRQARLPGLRHGSSGPSTRLGYRAGEPAPGYWPISSCRRKTAIYRSIDRLGFMRAKAGPGNLDTRRLGGPNYGSLAPLTEVLATDAMASEILHGDDTLVPRLAPGSGRTKTGRIWTYVRDERPFILPAPDRDSTLVARPQRRALAGSSRAPFTGVLPADGCAGFSGFRDRTHCRGGVLGALSGVGFYLE